MHVLLPCGNYTKKDKVCGVMYCLIFGMQTVRSKKKRSTGKRLDARLGVSSCFAEVFQSRYDFPMNRSQFPTLRYSILVHMP
jgi:hypothetical protein